jgi:hypothetical protein
MHAAGYWSLRAPRVEASRLHAALAAWQAAEIPSIVIPEAAKRLSGIHKSISKAETQGFWIPGSGLRPAPE